MFKIIVNLCLHCHFTALAVRQHASPNHQSISDSPPSVACFLCSGWNDFKDFGKVSAINNLAGTIAFIFGLLLWVTSVDWVRRRYYQSFHSVHILGFLGYVLFALIHYPGMWVGCVPGNLPCHLL